MKHLQQKHCYNETTYKNTTNFLPEARKNRAARWYEQTLTRCIDELNVKNAIVLRFPLGVKKNLPITWALCASQPFMQFFTATTLHSFHPRLFILFYFLRDLSSIGSAKSYCDILPSPQCSSLLLLHRECSTPSSRKEIAIELGSWHRVEHARTTVHTVPYML